MAAENIFSQYAQPVRSVADYMGDMDARDLRRQQLIGSQRQNALAALTAQQQTEGMARNALVQSAQRKAAETAGGDETAYAKNLRLSGMPELIDPADKVEKALTERGKAKSENGKRDTETENAVVSQWRDMIGMAVSPEHAAKMVAAMHADPRIANTPMAKVPLDQAMAMLQQTPFDQWKQQFALGATKFVEQNKPQYITQDLGGSSQITALPGLSGPAVVASNTPKTQTLESIATNETQRRGQNMTAGTAAAQLRQAQSHFEATQNAPKWDAANQVWVNQQKQTITPGVGTDGQPLPGKTLNDSQAKSYLFGSRMQAADKIISDMAAKGVLRPSNLNAVAGATPLVGGIGDSATNWMNSNEQAQVKQAKMDFMTAALRRESGASIAPSEFETFDKTYFPQIGDKPDQIANKAALRQRAVEGVLVEVPSDKRPKTEKSKPAATVTNW